MKIYKLNMVFDSYEECEKWEAENLSKNGRQMYNNEFIISVMHQEADNGKMILTEIWTC